MLYYVGKALGVVAEEIDKGVNSFVNGFRSVREEKEAKYDRLIQLSKKKKKEREKETE